ncbi:helix-turn-helix transcriptional regulator [Mycobacterium sp. B14F4]|uniref:helix-turn-helix transcriptional regulator n=1 Tax=Mycobacterium sp. B14F4 TaxID=3153565 RepID=UPI00325F076C
MSTISNIAVHVHPPERLEVEISDPADVDEFLEDAYGATLRLSHGANPHREGPLLTHVRTTVGPLAIEDVYAAGHLEARPDPLNRVIVVWPTTGRYSGSCDGMQSRAGVGDVALLAQPHLPSSATCDDLRLTGVLLDPAMVASVATGLPVSQAPLPIRFTSFDPVDASAARLWKKTTAYIKENVLADEVLATPLVIGHASRLLAAVTLRTFPNTATTTATPQDRTDHKPVLLRRAMAFMDANANCDIGLADIAEAVHVTPRAVQYMFRRHLETTPLQYLRRLRLHYAHHDLLAADRESDTVTDIAARWGFAHTGRFAVLYRHTYGESPHTTLRS